MLAAYIACMCMYVCILFRCQLAHETRVLCVADTSEPPKDMPHHLRRGGHGPGLGSGAAKKLQCGVPPSVSRDAAQVCRALAFCEALKIVPL